MAIEVSIMIEGQDGLSWPRWQRLARAAEELGFNGLYRSDHFTNPGGPFLDSVETWVSFAWLASHTERISFGSIVSPLSFRNPSILAWQASAIDSLAGGRLRIGVGAGWQEREHTAFGFHLGTLDERFARLEEGLEVIRALTRSTEPATFAGSHFSIADAMLQPRSPRSDGPPITIGGNGPRRTLPLVARYADEWNAVYLSIPEFQERNARLDGLLADAGRAPSDVKRTFMTRGLVGRDEAELRTQIAADDLASLRDKDAVVGTPGEMVERLGRLDEAGAEGVLLQWLNLDDIRGLETIAAEVLPQIR